MAVDGRKDPRMNDRPFAFCPNGISSFFSSFSSFFGSQLCKVEKGQETKEEGESDDA